MCSSAVLVSSPLLQRMHRAVMIDKKRLTEVEAERTAKGLPLHQPSDDADARHMR
jgi:hypothetical protein